MNNLKIFSGKSCKCDIGIPVPMLDFHGLDLHTGDIVQVWHGSYVGTDLECWMPTDGLTAVICDQYQSYTDGTIELKGDMNPYVMGIKDCGFDHPEWQVRIVKKWNSVVEGENWPAYGFRYGKSESADASKGNAK